MLHESDLHDYQLKAVDFIKEKRRCALFLDMGLGKTVSTLTAVADIVDSFAAKKVLVISPLRVANSVWPKEPAGWDHLSHLTVSQVTGSQQNRLKALQKSADVYSVNRENVKWLVDLYGSKWPFDLVIIDESSSFKDRSSQRFKALKKILPKTEYMVLLTGTPSPNGLLDLWSQMYLIDFGKRLGRTFTDYKKRFFESDYMGYNFTPKAGADEKIHALISDVCLSMSAADYLELPELITTFQKIPLSPAVLKAYDDFENSLFIELEDEAIEAQTAAVLAGKLLQYANGAMYSGDGGAWVPVHDEKIKALEEIVEVNDEPMLVAYNFKSDLARLKAKFPDAVQLKADPEIIERWNMGEIKMLLAHPASAGHGLNLQRGGSLCVWFGLNWSLELYQQFNARLYRQGQTKPVRLIHLCSEGTIDTRVVDVLGQKDAVQSGLLNALKK